MNAYSKFDTFRIHTSFALLRCMQVAAEDDALSTHSVVQLPVQAYTKRVDNLVNEFVAMGLADQAMTGDSDEV